VAREIVRLVVILMSLVDPEKLKLSRRERLITLAPPDSLSPTCSDSRGPKLRRLLDRVGKAVSRTLERNPELWIMFRCSPNPRFRFGIPAASARKFTLAYCTQDTDAYYWLDRVD
jgi:hypothetical protein